MYTPILYPVDSPSAIMRIFDPIPVRRIYAAAAKSGRSPLAAAWLPNAAKSGETKIDATQFAALVMKPVLRLDKDSGLV